MNVVGMAELFLDMCITKSGEVESNPCYHYTMHVQSTSHYSEHWLHIMLSNSNRR